MNDVAAMQLALEQAQKAFDAGEVPVGAIILHENKIIARGHNSCISDNNACAHAEINAISQAGKYLGNYRLNNCKIYISLEPCAMCAGAIINSRISEVIYAADEPKTGAISLNLGILESADNPPQIKSGVLKEQSKKIMQNFFKARRIENKAEKIPLRQDALRSDEANFTPLNLEILPTFFINDLPALNGLQMAYWDNISIINKNHKKTFLFLHFAPFWRYYWINIIDKIKNTGHRIIAPDFIGFGQSDKPKKQSFHSKELHELILTELINKICSKDEKIIIISQNDIGFADILFENQRIKKFINLKMNCINKIKLKDLPIEYKAPFTDSGYTAGIKAFREFEEYSNYNSVKEIIKEQDLEKEILKLI